MRFLALLSIGALAISAQDNNVIPIAPATMPTLGAVDSRFASYNIEMVEVTGGRFWKPYKSAVSNRPQSSPASSAEANQQVGVSPSLFQYRPPIDLRNPKLRKLAEALGPSYIRVSGSWANSTFFRNEDKAAPPQPPRGFMGVLTRSEWKRVLDFAQAVSGQIVTSFAISPGTRDEQGVWTPNQAKAFLDYTRSIGGTIAATEFMNEPTFPGPGGAPPGYDAAKYAEDAKLFGAFLHKESPHTIFLGPGSIGEGVSMMDATMAQMKTIASEDILKATGPIFDAFSYHFYGTVSKRCGGNMTVERALTPEWLDTTNQVEAFYASLRDKYTPGKPMWLTETAEAACGGDQVAAQFVDVFRYMNQLGALAQKGVRVVMHNTLASSDYGLLDEDTLAPTPDYWAVFVWKRTMGNVVLDPKIPKSQGLRVYAHCAKGGHGAVALVALNTNTAHELTITLPTVAQRFTLTAPELTSTKVLLNGTELRASADGSITIPAPKRVASGQLRLAPLSVTFLIISSANNKSCM